MSILVTATTALELTPFLEKNNGVKTLITGVGAPNTMYHLTKEIFNHNYSFIIQVGIAGAFSASQSLGEAVIVEKDCFADIGVHEKKSLQNIFDMGLANPNTMPFNEGFLMNHGVKQFDNGKIKVVNGITVNLISDNEVYLSQLQAKYRADIESMEGAAFHYVCLKEEIPFIQIRGMSNYVGERDKSNWKIKEAVDSSNSLVSDIIQIIQQKSV